MQPSLISVIIPVYNHTDALQQALSSIAEQTYKNIEVIVVDDGSDEEFSIFNFQFSKDIPIKLLRQEHTGAPAARNRGLREARGEYVIFWDADVVGEPEMLEKMVEILEKYPDASYAYCNFYWGQKPRKGALLPRGRAMPAQAFDPSVLKLRNYIHSTSLIRRADAVSWDESLKRFQDWDLWLTLLEQGKKGVWIDEYLFQVEPRKQGISSWLPSFVYQKPWRLLPGFRSRVKEFEAAQKVIRQKHHL